MRNCDARHILTAAAPLIHAARTLAPAYAHDTAPLSSADLDDLVRHAECRVFVFPFEAPSSPAFTLPRIYGFYPLALDQNANRFTREIGVRHEVAHVLRGELVEPTYFASYDYMGHAERVCDLFALADLVPGWALERARSGAELLREVVQAVSEYAEGWPADRLADRVELRLRLFQEHGI